MHCSGLCSLYQGCAGLFIKYFMLVKQLRNCAKVIVYFLCVYDLVTFAVSVTNKR